MFRNNTFVNGQTQTTTNVVNTPNNNTVQLDITNKILFYIVTGNLVELRKLINNSNIDSIIDKKNNYTSLHYAVKLPNNNIVEYLMSCGANPNIKQNEGKDAIRMIATIRSFFILSLFICFLIKFLHQPKRWVNLFQKMFRYIF